MSVAVGLGVEVAGPLQLPAEDSACQYRGPLHAGCTVPARWTRRGLTSAVSGWSQPYATKVPLARPARRWRPVRDPRRGCRRTRCSLERLCRLLGSSASSASLIRVSQRLQVGTDQWSPVQTGRVGRQLGHGVHASQLERFRAHPENAPDHGVPRLAAPDLRTPRPGALHRSRSAPRSAASSAGGRSQLRVSRALHLPPGGRVLRHQALDGHHHPGRHLAGRLGCAGLDRGTEPHADPGSATDGSAALWGRGVAAPDTDRDDRDPGRGGQRRGGRRHAATEPVR